MEWLSIPGMHARHYAASMAVTILVVMGLVGCAGERNQVGPDAVIDLGSLYGPSNLSNVDAGGQGVTEAFSGNVYEGLFKLNDDGLTYTFTLRQGVRFTPANRWFRKT